MLLHKEILKAKYEGIDYIKNYRCTAKKGNSIEVYFEKGKINITYLKNDIVKVFIGEENEECERTYAINEDVPSISVNFIENDKFIKIEGNIVDTYVSKENLKISFKDKNNNILCEDFKATGKKDKKIFVSKANDCTNYYGFGEKTGMLNKKGCYIENYNTDDPDYNDETELLYKTVPFYIGKKDKCCYGIYFDNSYRSYFDMGKSFKDMIFFGAVDGKIQYYFIPGKDIKDVVENYSYLTGTMPMPPKWSLGYQQCRYSYMTENEVRNLAEDFRKKEIPCDTIYLDIDYMDNYKVMTLDPNSFPNFKEMIKDLNEQGFKIVTILDPGVKVEEGYSVYENGLKKNAFIKKKDGELYKGEVWPGISTFPDFTNDNARKWWKEELKAFLKLGVSGIWNDMNEPAVFDNDIKTMPEDCIHDSDFGYVNHSKMHNVYGMQMSRCSHEAQIELRPNERPFSMTRDSFAGGQRYSSIWTGDNKSTWYHLRASIPMNCNLGLSGFSFVGNDVGGFSEDVEEELFIRWMELGTFLPIFRNHSAIYTRRQEPWSFGNAIEEICKKYIKLRYKLIPYIYNEYYKSYKKGLPVFRPMVMEFSKDANVANMDSQFMFGESMLIAPVLYKNSREKLIYLPEGSWYNFFTNEKYDGGKFYNININLDEIGVFIKEGSIIPTYEEDYNYIGEKEMPIKLKVYGNKGELQFYEDDGISNEYLNEKYNLYNIKFTNNEGKRNFNIEVINKGLDKESKFQIDYIK